MLRGTSTGARAGQATRFAASASASTRSAAEAPGGEYKLDLFEVERRRTEVLLETRKFIVNRYVPDVFEKKLEFDGKSYGPGDVVQARIEVSRTAGGPMKDAKANVVAISRWPRVPQADRREVHHRHRPASATKAVLNVRFKLPADIFENREGRAAERDAERQHPGRQRRRDRSSGRSRWSRRTSRSSSSPKAAR